MGVRGTRAGRALLLAAALLAPGAVARADGAVSYIDQSYAPATSAPTASKPESKLWYAHGSWWAVLQDGASQAEHIFRLRRSTEEWVDTGVVIDDRPGARADVLWDKAHDKLYVASHEYVASGTGSATSPGAVWRFSYDKGTYRLDAGFPVAVNGATSETLVIDMDSLGRLWATWTQDKQVYVSHATDATNTTWGAPYLLPVANPSTTTVMADDISALVAFDGRIGVMWSNQREGFDYFAVHADSAPDDATGWTSEQVPVDAAFPAFTFADDHFNLKADGKGNVYAAVKHSTDLFLENDTPFTSLLVRAPEGTWQRATITTTTERHTRAIVELDTEHRVIHVFDTGPVPGARSGDGGGTIYEKTSPMDAIVFGPGHGEPVIGGSGMGLLMNDATSTKQSLSSKTGLVVAASDTKGGRYWHADQTLGGTFALPPARTGSDATGGREGPSLEPEPPPPPNPSPLPPAPPAPPPAPPAPPPAPKRIVLRPVADGAVGGRAYLKFRVSGIAGRVTSAHLRLRVVTRRGAALFLASNRWNRASLRARRAPAEIGSRRLRVPSARHARLVDREVSFFVAGNGTYTLAIAGARSVAAPALVLTVA